MIRDLTAADAEAAAALTTGWTAADYKAIAHGEFPDRFCLLAASDEIEGVLVGSVIAPEAEIINIVVHPDRRRHGLARGLMRAAMDRMGHSGARKVRLEVRESNIAAVSLYESLGFRRAGLRREYYTFPDGKRENALVLETPLTIC